MAGELISEEAVLGLDDSDHELPHHLRWWLPITLFVLLLGLLVALAAGQVEGRETELSANLAPDFEMILLGEEQEIRLSQFRGQGVVVNFWASWCYPCRQEMALLESSWLAYRDEGVVFIGVNVWDEEAEALAFLKESGVTYMNGGDFDGDVAETNGLQGVPTTLFISSDGRLQHTIYGLLDGESLTHAIESIIPE